MTRHTYIGHDSDDGETDSQKRGRRWVMKTASALGLGGLTSLAGCSGQSGGDVSDRVEVPEMVMWGPTPEMGTENQTAELAFTTMAEELPLPISFEARRHSRSVEDAFFNHDFHAWYSMFTLRPERVDPHALLVSNLMSNETSCGSFNISEYENETAQELFEESARTLDRDARQELIHQIQEELATVEGDVPFSSERGLVFPVFPQLYNSALFGNITETSGLGIRNIWTFNECTVEGDEGTMIVVLTSESANLNPLISEAGNRSAVRNVYDSLTKMGPDGQPEPWLATDWESSDDNLQFTFDIRSGHSFHDGEPLTAEDVRFSYEYHAEHSPFFGGALSNITEMEAPDDTTVVFTLDEPFAPIFTQTFNRIPILPKHIWETVPEEVDAEEAFEWSPTEAGAFVGSGHMTFENWRRGSEIVLSRNDDHWRPANLDGIIFNVITNTQAIISGLEQGDYHLLWQLSGADPTTLVDLADNNDNLELVEVLSTGSRAMIMNTKFGPFSFPEVRAAVESVVPKGVIRNEVWDGLAEEGHGQYSPAVSFWHNPDQKKWGAEYTGREEAIAMLEERGFVFQDGTAYYPEGEAPPEELDGYGCE